MTHSGIVTTRQTEACALSMQGTCVAPPANLGDEDSGTRARRRPRAHGGERGSVCSGRAHVARAVGRHPRRGTVRRGRRAVPRRRARGASVRETRVASGLTSSAHRTKRKASSACLASSWTTRERAAMARLRPLAHVPGTARFERESNASPTRAPIVRKPSRVEISSPSTRELTSRSRSRLCCCFALKRKRHTCGRKRF